MPSAGPGARLGSYELLSLIGRGGMGEVYRARDGDLDRLVAIKILPSNLPADPVALGRFEREARLASALNHPNIVTIYSIGHVESVPYIVMELVEGKTLSAMLTSSRLSLRRVIDIAAQIASGLARAHEAGIAHRDLKPQNVMVRRDGLVKILDFGLSTLVPYRLEEASGISTVEQPSPLTRAGALVGSLHYMSPEQASGQPVDFRCDQFSFGVVLYEMVTGRRAFNRPTTVQTLSAIIEDHPTPVRDLNPAIPDALARVIDRCLAKDPRNRFASTEDLARDLQLLGEQPTERRGNSWPTGRAVGRTHSRRTFIWAAGTLAVVAALLSPPIVRERLWRPASRPTLSVPQHLAVLPFTNVGNDPANEPFCDGLVEVLTSQLTQVGQSGSLEVVPASDVRRQGITSAEDAGRAFGATRVITGSIQRSPTHARVTINLVDARTLRQISARSVDLELADITAMQDGVVRQVADLLGAALRPELHETLTRGGTRVPDAYNLYLQARGYLQRYEKLENVDLAIAAFDRAVQLDPQYALAHAGLGEAYWRKYERTKDTLWIEAARASCAKALALADDLAAIHLTLGMIDVGTGRYEEAVTELKRAIALDPLSADAYRELAKAYQSLGQKDEAENTFKAAIEIRPNYWANYNDLARFYFQSARYADAEAQYHKVIDLIPDSEQAYRNLGAVYYSTRRFDLAQKMFEKSVAIRPNAEGLSNLGTLYFAQGRYTDAARTLERAVRLNDKESLIWSNLAAALYWAPGEREKARGAYEKALALAQDESRVNPRDASLLMRMADCESRLGRPADAQRLIEAALRLAPNQVGLMFKAGMVYEQLGDRARALEWIRRAVAGGHPRDAVERSPELVQLRRDSRFVLQ